MTTQSRLESTVEILLNQIIGFIISLLVWPVVAIMLGIPYTHSQNLLIVLIFTVVSLARGYLIRRFFNNGLHMAAVNIAKNFLKA